MFISAGTAEHSRLDSVRHARGELDKVGVKYVAYDSPGTDHEWLTWRSALHESLSCSGNNHDGPGGTLQFEVGGHPGTIFDPTLVAFSRRQTATFLPRADPIRQVAVFTFVS